MGRSLKISGIWAIFIFLASLSASAGTICNFSNVKLTGTSGSNVSGTFTVDSTNHTFSNVSISFNGGAFGGINANGANMQGTWIQGQQYLYSWLTLVNGNLVGWAILYDFKTGQYEEWGGIANWQNKGSFNYLSVPEGGAELTYMMLSGIALFAGILVSGKQRRAARSSHSG